VRVWRERESPPRELELPVLALPVLALPERESPVRASGLPVRVFRVRGPELALPERESRVQALPEESQVRVSRRRGPELALPERASAQLVPESARREPESRPQVREWVPELAPGSARERASESRPQVREWVPAPESGQAREPGSRPQAPVLEQGSARGPEPEHRPLGLEPAREPPLVPDYRAPRAWERPRPLTTSHRRASPAR
jgi:hypothetical protein